MFTQMVVDKRQEKVYIYDREDIDDNYDLEKLHTIMEGGSSISSKLITDSKVCTDFTHEFSSHCDGRGKQIDPECFLENFKHRNRGTGETDEDKLKGEMLGNEMIDLKKQKSQFTEDAYGLNLYSSKEKSLNSIDSDGTAYIELDNDNYFYSQKFKEQSLSSSEEDENSNDEFAYAPKRDNNRFRLKSSSIIYESVLENKSSFRKSECDEFSSSSNTDYCIERAKDNLSSDSTEKLRDITQKTTSMLKDYCIVDK